MASHSLLLHLLLLLLAVVSATLTRYTSATGGAEIIDKLCSVTFAPVACSSCVKNGRPPAGPTWRDVDVVLGMMNCGDDDFNGLVQDILKVKEGATDQKVVAAMNECDPIIMAAQADAETVAEQAAARKFAEARAKIKPFIFDRLSRCAAIIKDFGIAPPPPVFSFPPRSSPI